MQDITDHPYSAHSRRPTQCRICKAPAGMHATCTDAFQGLWKSLRYPLVTDRFQGYSARTLGVLTAIAAQGGNVDSWDLGNRGWHKTAVSILIKDMILIELNPDTHPRQYTLSEAGRQVCAWHGIEITAQDGPAAPDTSTAPEVPTLPGAITTITGTLTVGTPFTITNDDTDGAPVTRVVESIVGDTYLTRRTDGTGLVNLSAKWLGIWLMNGELTIGTPVPAGDDAWKRAESEIWAGTGTVVRTRPRSFRKVKNTRSSRARRGGAR